MAYNLKYYYLFKSCNGKTVEIDIKEDGYTGSATLRRLGGAPVLKMENSGCIHGTSLELPAECVVEDEYADLYSTDPYLYQVDVIVGSRTVWKGYVTPELYSAPWIDPPYDVTVTATDGIGELKLHTFPAMGDVSLYSLLSTILGYTGLSFAINAINTAGNTAASASDLLTSTTVNLDHMAGETCYDVLQSVLESLHATIQQADCGWLIIRETDVNSMTSSGSVRDTSSNSYDIIEITSMADSDCWPVGQLRMEIQPAKNRVDVQCENHPHQNYLVDPNMVLDSWGGTATHRTGDGGYYEINPESNQYIRQRVVIPTNSIPGAANGDTANLTLTLRARQTDSEASHKVKIAIDAYGKKLGTTSYVHFWLTNTAYASGSGPGTWYEDTSIRYYEAELQGAVNGNSSDCTTVTVEIPWAALTKTRLLPDSTNPLTISIYADDQTVCVHGATLEAVTTYEGISTALIMNNAARGSYGTIEPAFADSLTKNYGASWIDNMCRTYSGTKVSTWYSAIMSSLPYGEFIAKDYALSCAMPRLRLQGRLNVQTDWMPLFFLTNGMMFQTETWSLDLLNDEVEVSILSLPASSIQVTSLVVTPTGAEDSTTDYSTAVAPTSFNVLHNDTSAHYISISQVNASAWSVSGYDSSWITFSKTSGTGTDTISFTLSENSGAARSSTFTIAGMPVKISQEAGSFSFSPSSVSVSEEMGSTAVTIDCGDSQEWSLSSNVTWCTVSGMATYSGTGPATVYLSYGQNVKSANRTATITVYRGSTAAGTITLAQAGIGAVVITSGLSVSSASGIYTIAVTDTANVGWQLSSDQSWCTISPSSGTGTNSAVVVTVGTNSSTSASRTATITCTPSTGTATTCVVTQAAATEVSISPTSLTFDPAGSTETVTITGSYTAWEVTSAPSWSSALGLAGNAPVIDLDASANTSGSSRSGSFTIVIDGTSYQVSATQAAQAATTYRFTISATPSGATVVINGSERTYIDCVAGTSITWSVSASGYVSQSGVYTMGSADHTETVTLTQEQTYTLSVTPTTASFTYDADEYDEGVTLLIEGNDSWTLTKPSWCTVYGNVTSGTCPAYIRIFPSGPNTSATPRTGTVTITGTHGETATCQLTQAALSFEITGEPSPPLNEESGYIVDPAVAVTWSVTTGAALCTTRESGGYFYVTPTGQAGDIIVIRATSTLDNTRYEEIQLEVSEGVEPIGDFIMDSTAYFTWSLGYKQISCVPVNIDTSTITVTKDDPDNIILILRYDSANQYIEFTFKTSADSSVDHSWSFTVSGTGTDGLPVAATIECYYVTG